MKKLFALVSMAALIASCTNDDFLDAGQQGKQQTDLSKGIVFGIADDATTRGYFEEGETGFGTFWNAEKDRIAVAFLNAKKGSAAVSENLWCAQTGATEGGANVSEVDLGGSSANGLAIYKTTKSGTKGLITSVDDANLLEFDDASQPKKASFRIFRPAYTVTNGVETTTQRTVKFRTNADKVGTMAVTLDDFTTQVQPDAKKVNFANFFMVADPIDEIHSSDLAVGESIELGFERPLSLLAIKTIGYDKDVYGKLKKVEVEKKSTSQHLSSSDATVDIAKKVKGAWAVTKGTGSSKVTLNMQNAGADGLEWNDDYYAYIQILPVAKGEYTVTLTFEKGTVAFTKEGANAWVANDFHKISVDLNSQDVYLNNSGTETLIINKGDLLKDATIFKYAGVDVTVADIKNVVSNKALTKAELAILKKQYTGMTSLTLKGTEDLGENLANVLGTTAQTKLNSLTLTEATTAPKLDVNTLAALATLSCPKATTVPAEAYKENTKLTNVNLPLVETIGENAFNGATEIKVISCGTPAMNQLTIGTTEKDKDGTTVIGTSSALSSIEAGAFTGTALETIHIPSQVTIAARAFGTTPINTLTKLQLPQYDFSQAANVLNAMVLLNGTALQEVDLSAVSVIDGTAIVFTQAYLNTVTLKVGAQITGPAFKDCSNLATVKNLDKAATIGESAFEGTGLTAVTVNAEAIGKNAFKNCSSLVSLTLGTDVKTIGEGAFTGTGITTLSNRASIATIGKEAFKSITGITAFDFMEATTIGEGAFQGCTGLAGTVYSNAAAVAKNVFNGANKVDLFRFYKATSIEEGALQGIKNDASVVFSAELTSINGKAFTYSAAGGDGSTEEKAITGTIAVKLTLNAAQAGIKGNVWTFEGVDGKFYKLTFTQITK